MLDAGESYRTVAHILGNSESTLRLHYDGRTDVGTRRAIAALELQPATSPADVGLATARGVVGEQALELVARDDDPTTEPLRGDLPSLDAVVRGRA